MKIIPKAKLEAEGVRKLTEELLMEQLPIAISGYKWSRAMVLNVLVQAAIEKRRIEAVCADLRDVVDSNTLREALNTGLTTDDLTKHQAAFKGALAAGIPTAMPRQGGGNSNSNFSNR